MGSSTEAKRRSTRADRANRKPETIPPTMNTAAENMQTIPEADAPPWVLLAQMVRLTPQTEALAIVRPRNPYAAQRR